MHTSNGPSLRTPTAFNHPAQGCEARATLGLLPKSALNPERVALVDAGLRQGFNPFRVGRIFRVPRVGVPTSRQPWADRLNAVGVSHSANSPVEIVSYAPLLTSAHEYDQ